MLRENAGQRVFIDHADYRGQHGEVLHCTDHAPDDPQGSWLVRLDSGEEVDFHGSELELLAADDPANAPLHHYKVEVQTTGDGDRWVGNLIEYRCVDHAVTAAKDLFFRWLATTNWRVVDESGTVVRERS